MATRADCIRAAVSAGATEEQAADIVTAIMEEKKRLRAEGRLTPEELARAWQARAPEVERATALKRRRAVFASWADPLARELDGIGADELGRGGVLRLLREDKSFHDAVIVAMREPDAAADPLARETADIIARYAEAARQRFNLAGGDMGRLDGWTPQRHDAAKLLKAGPDAWQKTVLPLLDMERTFGRDADADTVREILSGIYDDLVVGRNPFLAGSGTAKGRDMAAPLEHSRELHFKSGKDAVAYNDRFGAGNIFDATLQHLDRMARAVALMERLGPTPEQTVRRLIDDERLRVHADATLDHATRQTLDRELDAAMTRGVTSGATAKWLAELTGEANECAFPTLARVSYVLRATQTLSKLGGAALSATSDVFIKAASMRCNGTTWPEAIVKSVLQYLDNYRDGPTRRAAAGQAGAFLDALTGSMAAAWDTDGDAIGKIARAQNWLFRWSGLNWITAQGKAGYGLWLSRHLGEAAAHGWDALHPDVRAMLDWHGVDAARWDVLRGMTAVDEEGRRCFLPVDVPPDAAKLEALLPERLRGEPPSDPEQAARFAAAREAELARLRERVRTDALAMLTDETGFAILEPDDAVRAITRQGLRRGTHAGEFWRCLMQFKSFSVSYMQRVLGGRRWVRGSRQSGMRYGFGAGTVTDALSRDMPGGLGIFGDFLFGETSRFGSSFTAAGAGPVAGMVEDLAKIPGLILHGEPKQARDQFITTALDNAPFVNMWYTRTALNYALLYHIKEWLSPGSLRRMDRRMKKKERGSFLPPSSVIARGGGFR